MADNEVRETSASMGSGSVVPTEDLREILHQIRDALVLLKNERPTKQGTVRRDAAPEPVLSDQLVFFKFSALLWGHDRTDGILHMMGEHPGLFLQVDSKGRTALHAGVIANSEILVEKLMQNLQQLAKDDCANSSVREFLNHVDKRFKLTAPKMAIIIGNENILEIFVKYRFCESHRKCDWVPPTGVSRGWVQEIQKLLEPVLSKVLAGTGKSWEKGLKLNEGNEFAVHNALLHLDLDGLTQFMKSVERAIPSDARHHFLSIRDKQGRTPLHRLACRDDMDTKNALRLLGHHFPDLDTNAPDFANRTPLHWAAAQGFHKVVAALAEKEETNLNASFSAVYEFLGEGGEDDQDKSRAPELMRDSPKLVTALHLAVVHNHFDVVQALLSDESRRYPPFGPLKVNVTCYRFIKLANFCSGHECAWTPFQIAALKGHVQTLRILLKDEFNLYAPQLPGFGQPCLANHKLSEDARLYDCGMMNIPKTPPLGYNKIPALHLAAASGHPFAVEALLNSGKINPLALDKDGNTALHYAAAVAGNTSDFDSPYFYVSLDNYSKYAPHNMRNSGEDVMSCMDLLMQSGLSTKQVNEHGVIPELIASSSDRVRKWWFGKLAQEAYEQKQSLSIAANAVSVTAALVATASFVGPLQPPLGLSTDASQTWLMGHSLVNNPAVEVFLFFDGLSFYFAIASIVFAMLPSWPIPHEGLAQEVRIARRGVQFAVLLLFASLVFVIIAFGAASIAILPQGKWKYKALGVVSTTLGASVCFLILFLSLLRLLKFILTRGEFARKISDMANSVLLWTAS